jgi:hypothetical protein
MEGSRIKEACGVHMECMALVGTMRLRVSCIHPERPSSSPFRLPFSPDLWGSSTICGRPSLSALSLDFYRLVSRVVITTVSSFSSSSEVSFLVSLSDAISGADLKPE